MFVKIAAIALIFFGEVFAIGAEMWGAKYVEYGEKWLQAFFLLMIPMTFGGALLLAGYMFGYAHLKNIWLITAVSVASIVVVEPLLAYILFNQLPTLGATVGLALGFAGILAVLLLP